MTTDTCASHRCSILALRSRLFVATLTTYFAVCTIQQILGSLVMVEIPQLPRPGVMTTLTFFTQCELVFVFLFMAAITISGGILEPVCLVATLAGSGHMPPSQGKTGQSMVKPGNAPRTIVVTRLTRCTSLPLMLVVFFVTTETIHGRFPITFQILVTSSAFQRRRSMCVTH
jgi:hypothetical protein